MVNILKFKYANSSKIFVISDLHIRHTKLLESRGFKTIEEHDKTIIDNWNSIVDNESVVFALGDIIVGAKDKGIETFEYLINTLNFKELYICPGNHYSGYRQFFNKTLETVKIDKYYRLTYSFGVKLVHFVPNYYEIYIGSQPVVLSHYPILSFNGMAAGSILLFGHCHNSLEKTAWIKDNYLVGKCMDVGWDNHRKPLSFTEIKNIMDNRSIIKVDHHDSSTSF